MNRRWICSDVWMDIMPSFDHAQLGLKMALLSDRFDVLVDAHFDGKTTELTISRQIIICKDNEMPKLFVEDKSEGFPLPDRPLPNKIRFKELWIDYIDHSVITFLRSNQQIWDRIGTNFDLSIENNALPNWDIFIRQIWPIFSANIRHLRFNGAVHLDNLRRLISPTILTDLDQLNAINSAGLFPDGIDDDGPNATAGQALTKWLHTPRKDGQPKRLRCWTHSYRLNFEWITNFKETFPRATTSASYKISFGVYGYGPKQIKPFELVNEQTKEKLTFSKESNVNWLLKRCPIIVGETAAVQKQREKDENLADVLYYSGANLNRLFFHLGGFQNYIGQLSPPADKSDENVCSSTAGPRSDQRNE